jgi:hypothetical protein
LCSERLECLLSVIRVNGSQKEELCCGSDIDVRVNVIDTMQLIRVFLDLSPIVDALFGIQKDDMQTGEINFSRDDPIHMLTDHNVVLTLIIS